MPLLEAGNYMVYRQGMIMDMFVEPPNRLAISNKFTIKTFAEWDAMVAATPGGDPALLESLGITLDLRDGE